jgi:hypothetical protein
VECIGFFFDESVKRDLKECNISKELAMDRSAWRLAISVPEQPLFLLSLFTLNSTCYLVHFLCFSYPCFFWVSSLAYPDLIGAKGYVVVAFVFGMY